MLLSAKDGDMLPPTTAAAGIELYAVCGRRAIKADDKQRNKAQEDLQTSSSRSWPSATCATSGRMRTSNTGERCDSPRAACTRRMPAPSP